MRKLYWVGKHLELRTVIPVTKLKNDEDWDFVFWPTIDGKTQMAVF